MKKSFWIACGFILCIHLAFLIAGSFDRSYDAWTHLFFASHWAHNWWQSFEPRWYTGFSILTYPPFAHQTLAIPVKIMGLATGFIVMQMMSLVALAIGIWRYTRLWFDQEVAQVATVLGLASPALALTLHLFGQYPNIVSMALIFNLLPWVDRWLQGGDWKYLLKAELLLIATACTSLFTNFLGVALLALPILIRHNPRPLSERLKKYALLVGLGSVTLVGCLFPLWQYLSVSPLSQVSIPHASRGNVLWSPDSYFTFYGLYGPLLLLLLPLLMWMWRQRLWGFIAASVIAFLFSLGGSNPFNHMILGRFFDILTFDRFAFWCSLILLPPVAAMGVRLWHQRSHLPETVQHILPELALVVYGVFFIANAASPFWKSLPQPIQVQSIIERLEQEQYRDGRFLSLGIGGNYLAALTAQSQAQSVDGNYNFGRRLPVLNQSPMALLDEAKYYGDDGIQTLAKVLADPARYQLRTVVLKDLYYTPLLQSTGWEWQENLEQGVQLWRHSSPFMPIRPFEPEPIGLGQLFWGVIPLLSPVVLLGVLLWESRQKRLKSA